MKIITAVIGLLVVAYVVYANISGESFETTINGQPYECTVISPAQNWTGQDLICEFKG